MEKEERKRLLKEHVQRQRAWVEQVPVSDGPQVFSDAHAAQLRREMARHHQEWKQSLLNSGLSKQDLRDCGIDPDSSNLWL